MWYTIIKNTSECFRIEGDEMVKFRTSLFGYNKYSVDQYFLNMEKQNESMMQAKYGELDALKESIQKSRSKLRMSEKEIEDFSRRKEQIFSVFVDQLVVIEQSIKTTHEEMRKAKLAELNRLKNKVNELEKWNALLQQCHSEISAVHNKFKDSAR